MFIRRSITRNGLTGEAYYTYRLVRTARIGAKAASLRVAGARRMPA